MVFQKVLAEPAKRAEQIIRLVALLNVDFHSDQRAFETMIRGRELSNLFEDRVYIDRIFHASKSAAANPSHIDHQQAIFELNHSSGNIGVAIELLNRAEQGTSGSVHAIRHTRATALRKLANNSHSKIERDKLRSEAIGIATWLANRSRTSHPYTCLLYTSPSPRDLSTSRMPSSA